MYSLVGVNGNAFALIGYTKKALKETGLGTLAQTMYEEATSSDYNNVVVTCQKYIDMANERSEADV